MVMLPHNSHPLAGVRKRFQVPAVLFLTIIVLSSLSPILASFSEGLFLSNVLALPLILPAMILFFSLLSPLLTKFILKGKPLLDEKILSRFREVEEKPGVFIKSRYIIPQRPDMLASFLVSGISERSPALYITENLLAPEMLEYAVAILHHETGHIKLQHLQKAVVNLLALIFLT